METLGIFHLAYFQRQQGFFSYLEIDQTRIFVHQLGALQAFFSFQSKNSSISYFTCTKYSNQVRFFNQKIIKSPLLRQKEGQGSRKLPSQWVFSTFCSPDTKWRLCGELCMISGLRTTFGLGTVLNFVWSRLSRSSLGRRMWSRTVLLGLGQRDHAVRNQPFSGSAMTVENSLWWWIKIVTAKLFSGR